MCIFAGLCSADMYPLSAVDGVSSKFVFAVLLSDHFTDFATKVSVRSGIPKINREELAQYRLAVPPEREQRAIAAALADADEWIASLDRLIAKKRDIKQAAMQQLLTGKTRLPGFQKKRGFRQAEVGSIPEDWDLNNFGSLYAESSRNGIYKSAEHRGQGTRIVNMGEMFGFDFISNQEMNRVSLTAREIQTAGLAKGNLLFGRRSVVPAGAGKCTLVVGSLEPLVFEFVDYPS